MQHSQKTLTHNPYHFAPYPWYHSR